MGAGSVGIARVRPDEAEVLARLMQLYLHDFSGFMPLESPYGHLADDGLFVYPHLASYWTEARREPLFVRVDGRLAGFVLLNDWSVLGRPLDFAVAEFFIARQFRRRGIGTEVVRQVLASRPGTWEIAVLALNAPALAFWRRVLPAAHAGAIEVVENCDQRWRGPIFRLTHVPAG